MLKRLTSFLRNRRIENTCVPSKEEEDESQPPRPRRLTLPSSPSDPSLDPSQTTHPQSQSPFFAKLPLEIRTRIYHEALGERTFHIHVKDNRLGHTVCDLHPTEWGFTPSTHCQTWRCWRVLDKEAFFAGRCWRSTNGTFFAAKTEHDVLSDDGFVSLLRTCRYMYVYYPLPTGLRALDTTFGISRVSKALPRNCIGYSRTQWPFSFARFREWVSNRALIHVVAAIRYSEALSTLYTSTRFSFSSISTLLAFLKCVPHHRLYLLRHIHLEWSFHYLFYNIRRQNVQLYHERTWGKTWALLSQANGLKNLTIEFIDGGEAGRIEREREGRIFEPLVGVRAQRKELRVPWERWWRDEEEDRRRDLWVVGRGEYR